MIPPGTRPAALTIGAAYAKALELLNAGRLDEAHKVCQDIVAVRPKQPDVHNLLAAIAYRKRDVDGAVRHFRRSLKLDPDNLETQLNLARTYRDFEQWAEAARAYEAVAKRTPTDAGVLYDLGKAYFNLEQFTDAERCYRQAFNFPSALTDNIEAELASILTRRGALSEAEQHYAAILARTPHFVPALINLSILRDAQGRMDDVVPFLDAAVAADPQQVDAQTQRALALLTRGRFAEAWPAYRWRFQRANAATLHAIFSAPFWNGEPLGGRRILIWTEQGLGDEILIAGLIPALLAHGAQCALVCTSRLVDLFQRSFPTVAIYTRDAVKKDPAIVGDVDFQASLSHLGTHVLPSFDAFPRNVPYLEADAAQTEDFRRRYKGGSTDRVIGIAWHSANAKAGSEKSSTLTDWADILRTPGCRFVSLQYGSHTAVYRALRENTGLDLIVDKTVDSYKDVDRFAAQVAAMDHVISVSNTTVHVAGALGVPVWTLVPASYGRIWYWFLDRTDSPWYPTMRLFRQDRGQGWMPTLQSVAQELRLLP